MNTRNSVRPEVLAARKCADELINICEAAQRLAKRTGNTFVMDRERVALMIAGHFTALRTLAAGDVQTSIATIAQLRRYCSAAARDYDGILRVMENAVGSSLADSFRKTAKELRETSEFMQAAAEGRENGLIYDDELSQALREIERLKAAANTRTPDSSESPPPGIFAESISPDKQRVERLETRVIELTAALRGHDDYMTEHYADGPDSGALHPDAALNWKRVRAALNGRTGV